MDEKGWLARPDSVLARGNRLGIEGNPTKEDEHRAPGRKNKMTPEQKKAEKRRRDRELKLLSRRGVTEEQKQRTIQEQDGKCAICKRPFVDDKYVYLPKGASGRPRFKQAPQHPQQSCQDHVRFPWEGNDDRTEGMPRGVLCFDCNSSRFHDDPAILRNAADYFEKWRPKWVKWRGWYAMNNYWPRDGYEREWAQWKRELRADKEEQAKLAAFDEQQRQLQLASQERRRLRVQRAWDERRRDREAMKELENG
jgi:hypothetical protein